QRSYRGGTLITPSQPVCKGASMTARNQHPSDAAALGRALADLSRGDDYTRGVLDLLVLLGLVEPGEGGFQPGGEVSAMVIASLRAHLADGVRVGLHWDDLDA